jgi:hypothetical protein
MNKDSKMLAEAYEEVKKHFMPDKWYAHYMGSVVGPYDSKEEAWKDCGGDVKWVKLGEEITGRKA